MRNKYVLIILAILMGLKMNAQDTWYYQQNIRTGQIEKYWSTINAHQIGIKFKDGTSLSTKNDIIKSAKIAGSYSFSLKALEEYKDNTFYPEIILISGQINRNQILELIMSLNVFPEIEFAVPWYIMQNNKDWYPTGEISLKLQQLTDYKTFESLLREYNISIKTKIKGLDRAYYMVVNTKDKTAAIETSKKLYESGLFEYAVPLFSHNRSRVQGDPLLSEQWPVNNNSDLINAWQISQGQGIRIAIIDTGVDMEHEDLNVVDGYDATGYNNGGSYFKYSVQTNAHGTACAGIAGAKKDNGMGIVGVAPGCDLISVSCVFYAGSNEYFEMGWLTEAIRYAYEDAKADVISLSFGDINSGDPALNAMITDATTIGRNGKGCIFLASSGNDNNNSVTYPASHNDIIAVGASGPDNKRWGWDLSLSGSNYGADLDLVVPGGVDIATTDITGDKGYSNDYAPYPDYTTDFSGTSAACPFAAGIAALMLGANPELTAVEVREKLRESCDQTSDYSFDANGFNEEVGYGFANPHEAVLLALPPAPQPVAPCKVDFIFAQFNGIPSVRNRLNQCENYTLENTTNECSSTSVLWSFSPSESVHCSSYTTDDPSVAFLTSGTYTITLTVTNSSGDSFSKSHTVNVDNNFTVSLSDNVTKCADETVVLGQDATINGGTAPYQYIWEGNGSFEYVPNTNNKMIEVSIDISTLYRISVTDNFGCLAQRYVMVNVYSPVVKIIGDEQLVIGEESELQAQATEGSSPYSYMWNQNATDNSPTLEIYHDQSGQFNYEVQVTDNNSCTATDDFQVTVIEMSDADIPEVVEITAESISLEWPEIKGAKEYKIFDCQSSLLATTTKKSHTFSGLNRGTDYCFVLQGENDETQSGLSPQLHVTTQYVDIPENIRLIPLANNEIEILWDEVDGADSYEVYDCSGNLLNTSTGTNLLHDISSNQQPEYGYQVLAKAGSNNSLKSECQYIGYPDWQPEFNISLQEKSSSYVILEWGQIPDATDYEIYNDAGEHLGTSGDLHFLISQLNSNTEYSFRMRAKKADNTYSVFSPRFTVKTNLLEPHVYIREPGSTSIYFKWYDYPDAVSYSIRNHTTNQAFGATGSDYTIENLNPVTKYRIEIIVRNSENNTGSTGIMTITTTLDPPENITATAISPSEIRLEFDQIPNIHEYEIYSCDELYYGTKRNPIFSRVITTIDNLKSGKEYSFKIRSKFQEIYSDFSECVTATTFIESDKLFDLSCNYNNLCNQRNQYSFSIVPYDQNLEYTWEIEGDESSRTDVGSASFSINDKLNAYKNVTILVSAWSGGNIINTQKVNLKECFATCGTIVSEDKYYETREINGQCWLLDNLNTGTQVDAGQSSNNSVVEKYCPLGDCDDLGQDYYSPGQGLYTWDETMQGNPSEITNGNTQGACPEGWRLPTIVDIEDLSFKIGYDETKIFSRHPGYWYDNEECNESEYKSSNEGVTLYWTSSEIDATYAYAYGFDDNGEIHEEHVKKDDALAVKCIENSNEIVEDDKYALSVQSSSNKSIVNEIGDIISFTITISNDCNYVIENIIFQCDLPLGLEFAGGENIEHDKGIVKTSQFDLYANAIKTLTLDVKLTRRCDLVNFNFDIVRADGVPNIHTLGTSESINLGPCSFTDPETGVDAMNIGNTVWMANNITVDGSVMINSSELLGIKSDEGGADGIGTTQGLCPVGWHMPTISELSVFEEIVMQGWQNGYLYYDFSNMNSDPNPLISDPYFSFISSSKSMPLSSFPISLQTGQDVYRSYVLSSKDRCNNDELLSTYTGDIFTDARYQTNFLRCTKDVPLGIKVTEAAKSGNIIAYSIIVENNTDNTITDIALQCVLPEQSALYSYLDNIVTVPADNGKKLYKAPNTFNLESGKHKKLWFSIEVSEQLNEVVNCVQVTEANGITDLPIEKSITSKLNRDIFIANVHVTPTILSQTTDQLKIDYHLIVNDGRKNVEVEYFLTPYPDGEKVPFYYPQQVENITITKKDQLVIANFDISSLFIKGDYYLGIKIYDQNDNSRDDTQYITLPGSINEEKRSKRAINNPSANGEAIISYIGILSFETNEDIEIQSDDAFYSVRQGNYIPLNFSVSNNGNVDTDVHLECFLSDEASDAFESMNLLWSDDISMKPSGLKEFTDKVTVLPYETLGQKFIILKATYLSEGIEKQVLYLWPINVETLYQVDYHLSDATCNDCADGTININAVSGFNEPYSIYWEDGYQGRFRDNLAPRIYIATITDASGISITRDFVIDVKEQKELNISDIAIKPGITDAKIVWNDLQTKYVLRYKAIDDPDFTVINTSIPELTISNLQSGVAYACQIKFKDYEFWSPYTEEFIFFTKDASQVDENVPFIAAQQNLSTFEEEPVTIVYDNLGILDADTHYPMYFTVYVLAGQNYEFVNNTVTPEPGFTGVLNVPVYVNDGTNNSNTVTIQIDVLPKQIADLTISELFLNETNFLANSDVEIDYVLKNEGFDISGPSYTGVFLSIDDIYSEDDRFLGSFYVGEVTNSKSIYEKGNIHIPANVSSGDYYLILHADFQNDIAESNNANNTSSTLLTVTSKPDLVIENVLSDVISQQAGRDISIECDILNIGTAPADASTLKIYMSADDVQSADDVLLEEISISTLEPDDIHNDNTIITIPQGTTPGQWNLLLISDIEENIDELDEGNNKEVISVEITELSTLPDLSVSNTTIAPGSITSGQQMSLSYTVNNLGQQFVYWTYVRFFLSSDEILDIGEDVEIGNKAAYWLSAGGSKSFSYNLTFNETSTYGTNYILFVPDLNNAIVESDETNNIAYHEFIYSGAQADITIPDMMVSSSEISFGQQFQLDYNIQNSGTSGVGQSTFKIFISQDDQLNIGIDECIYTATVPSLPGSTISPQTATVTLPETDMTGDVFIIAFADAEEEISEALEDNNTQNLPITIIPDIAELKFKESLISPLSVKPGNIINFNADIENSGATSSGATEIEFYILSSQGEPEFHAYFLHLKDISDIPARQLLEDWHYELFVPTFVVPGHYDLYAHINPSNNVIEANDENNVLVTQIEVLSSLPDLIFSQTDFSNISFEAGTVANVKYIINNDGGSNSGAAIVDVVLCSQDFITSEDIVLHSEKINALVSGAFYSNNLDLIIPENTQPGNKYLILNITPESNTIESDLSNNTQVFDIVITNQNEIPQIISCQQINAFEETNFEIFHHFLDVNDPDNNWPTDFSITVYAGMNYEVNGTIVSPDNNFTGMLEIPVSVNDGNDESDQYIISVDVENINDAPEITGCNIVSALEETPFELTLSDILVNDIDNIYPYEHSLQIQSGDYFEIQSIASGYSIAPVIDYTGPISIPVIVRDGEANSDLFEIVIDVANTNDPPVITGNHDVEMDMNSEYIITLSDLIIEDIDNSINELSVIISDGLNYEHENTVIEPYTDFYGELLVNVKVYDGIDVSSNYELPIQVNFVEYSLPIPENISLTAISPHDIQIQWDIVEGADFYNIYSGYDNSLIETVTGTSYVKSSLTSNTNYAFKVQAVNASSSSSLSSSYEMYTMLEDVSGISVTGISDTEINLAWDEVIGAEEYEIYFCGSSHIATIPASSTSFLKDGLSPGTEYSFMILAINSNTSSAENPQCDNGLTLPNAPTVYINDVSSDAIEIAWNTVNGANQYEVIDCDNDDVIATVTNTQFLKDNLSPATEYSFKVRAVITEETKSDFSNCISEYTLLNVPVLSSITALSSSEIEIIWNTVDGATDYEIFSCNNSNTYTTSGTSIQITNLVPGYEYSYKIRAVSGSISSDFSSCYSTYIDYPVPTSLQTMSYSDRIDLFWDVVDGAYGYEVYFCDGTFITTTTMPFSQEIDNLSPGTEYCLKVRAVFGDGVESDFSEPVSDYTRLESPVINFTTAISETEIELSWNSVFNADYYEVYFCGGSSIGSTSSTSFTVDGLNPGIEYGFMVSAESYSSLPYSSETSGCEYEWTQEVIVPNLLIDINYEGERVWVNNNTLYYQFLIVNLDDVYSPYVDYSIYFDGDNIDGGSAGGISPGGYQFYDGSYSLPSGLEEGYYSFEVSIDGYSISDQVEVYIDTLDLKSFNKDKLISNDMEGKWDFILSPNPANNFVNLFFDKEIHGESFLLVTDILGKKLIQKKVYFAHSKTEKMDISSLSKGVYLVSVINNKTIKTTRLVISK